MTSHAPCQSALFIRSSTASSLSDWLTPSRLRSRKIQRRVKETIHHHRLSPAQRRKANGSECRSVTCGRRRFETVEKARSEVRLRNEFRAPGSGGRDCGETPQSPFPMTSGTRSPSPPRHPSLAAPFESMSVIREKAGNHFRCLCDP